MVTSSASTSPLNVALPANVALFVELSNTNIFEEPPFHFVPKIISPNAAAWLANPPPPEYISTLPLYEFAAPPLVSPESDINAPSVLSFHPISWRL